MYEQGPWILSAIGLVGAVCAGLFKVIQARGCTCEVLWPNGQKCVAVKCEETDTSESSADRRLIEALQRTIRCERQIHERREQHDLELA